MKKFRLVALLALFLCAVMLLAACGSSKKASDPRDVKALKLDQMIKSVSAEQTAVTAARVSGLEGEVFECDGALYLFTKQNDSNDIVALTVYNVDLDKVVYSLTDAAAIANIAGIDLSDPVFTVSDGDKKTVTLYAGDGTLTATANDLTAGAYFAGSDIVLFDGIAYRYGEGDAQYTLTAVKDFNKLSPLPANFNKVGDHYYSEVKNWNNNVIGILVYDESLGIVCNYQFSHLDSLDDYYVLKNGNVAIQYVVDLPDDAQEYDLFDGQKYQVVSEVLNIKKGTAKEVEFPYLITNLFPMIVEEDDDIVPAKGLDNIATVRPIVNKTVQSGTEMSLSVGDDLSVKGRLDRMVENQKNGTLFNGYTNEYFFFQLIDGNYAITNAKGKEIGRITANADLHDAFIMCGTAFYDYSFTLLYDPAANGFDVEDLYEGCAILSKDNANHVTEYYIWKPGSQPTLIDGETDALTYQTLNGSVFMVVDSTNLAKQKITYYSEKGEAILSTENVGVLNTTSLGSGGSNARLYKGTDGETTKPVYYRVTK